MEKIGPKIGWENRAKNRVEKIGQKMGLKIGQKIGWKNWAKNGGGKIGRKKLGKKIGQKIGWILICDHSIIKRLFCAKVGINL